MIINQCRSEQDSGSICHLYKKKKTWCRKKEDFSKLEHLKKKGTVTDYDMELASYMESKYRKEDKIIKISNLKYIDVRYTIDI